MSEKCYDLFILSGTQVENFLNVEKSLKKYFLRNWEKKRNLTCSLNLFCLKIHLEN